MAESSRWEADALVDMPIAAIEKSKRLTIIALTPLDLEDGVCLGQQPLAALGGVRVVSACLDRPLRIGGWDSLAHQPLALRSVLPPGSVLFCTIDDPQSLRGAVQVAPGWPQIGERQHWGFGVVALGTW